jgi:hypothetical protein
MTTTFVSHKGTAHPENKADYWAARDRLEKAGWVKLGNGAYGAVYRHPDCADTVLKIGSFAYGDERRDGWLNYVRANAKTRSPHAPKVHAVEVYDGYFYAEMEPLIPMDEARYQAEGLKPYRDSNDKSDMRPSMKAFQRRNERIHGRLDDMGIPLSIDCHRNNYMVRPSTGETVLTDPWAN